MDRHTNWKLGCGKIRLRSVTLTTVTLADGHKRQVHRYIRGQSN